MFTGNAIKVGCEKLLNAMRKPDGTYRTYDEMVAEKIPLRYDGKWAGRGLHGLRRGDRPGRALPDLHVRLFMPEVEVDSETGKTTVVKFTTAVDVGTINNRATVDGQIYGGIAQGIGLALTEDFEDLKKHTTLSECGMPVHPKDIPDNIEIHLPRNAAADRPVRRGRRRRSAADLAASGDPQRHLQRLRRAHLPRAGAGGQHQAGA